MPESKKSEEIRELTDDELAAIIAWEIKDAVANRDTSIASDQAESIRYYMGKPFGNEVSDRSSVVLTDVRDTVEWVLPTLMRIFFGSRQVVRYMPQGPGDEAYAKQATDYAAYLTRRGNAGFTIFHDWFKDALIEKIGAAMVYFEEKEQRELFRYQGLTQDQFDALIAEDDVELVAFEETTKLEEAPPEEELPEMPMPGMPPPGLPPGVAAPGLPMPPEALSEMIEEPDEPLEVSEFEVHIRRIKPANQVKIEGIPQEEFLVAKRARIVDDDCPFVGRKMKRTYGDLRAMGISDDVIESLPTTTTPEDSMGSIERNDDGDGIDDTARGRPDWASKEVWLTECWIRVDRDGDGYAELRHVLCAGDSKVTILEDDEVSHVPIATLCPVPIPHRLYGLSMADLIKDLQLIRSTLLRQMLDNIYLQNNSRYAVVENEVDLDDFLTSSPGGYVRMSAPGMVEPLITQPLGPGAWHLLEYLHGVKENRTGVTRYNQGSDASSLNSTATGVSAIMEAANLRIEMIARIFAETGVTRLYQQLLYVMRENKVEAEVVRLRDDWVTLEPDAWRADLDVEVEVGLGTSQTATRVDNMMLLRDLQQQVLESDPRMVTPENVYAVVERIPEAMGFPTKGMFFTEPDPNVPLPPDPPDPKLIEAQAKNQEIGAKVQMDRESLQFRKYQADLEAQLKREQMQMDRETRLEVARIQAQATVEQARITSEDRENAAIANELAS